MKRKGGKYSWTMMLFRPAQESIDDFQQQVWDIWRKPHAEKMAGTLRIKFALEWEPTETAKAVNDRVIAKELERYPHSKPMVNPLAETEKTSKA